MPEDSSGIAQGSDGNAQRRIAQSPQVGSASDRDGTARIKPRLARLGFIRFLSIANLDGRTRAAARCRELIRDFTSDLGGDEALTAAQRQLILRASILGVICEDFETRHATGGVIEFEDYLRTIGVQRRILVTLGLDRHPRDISPNGRPPLRERLLAAMPSEADTEVSDVG
jgi:hypothetical protein